MAHGAKAQGAREKGHRAWGIGRKAQDAGHRSLESGAKDEKRKPRAKIKNFGILVSSWRI